MSDAADLHMLLLIEILVWASLGMVVGLSVAYFNLWRGNTWKVTMLSAVGGVGGGLLFKIIPGMSLQSFDVLALIGALLGATALIILMGRHTGSALPMS
jgi:hypothetical protein